MFAAKRGIVILGGTFDPIHLGHLRPVEEVRQVLDADRILLIPAGQPPHRGHPRCSAAHRLAMTRLAVGRHPPFEVLDWEIHQQGPSFAVETLARLRREQGHTPLCFVLGRDAFLRFDTWHRWREILDLVHLVVTLRPGWSHPDLPEVLKCEVQARAADLPSSLLRTPAGRILFQEVTPLGISSTQIRRLLGQNRSPRFLLPQPVLDYIDAHALYRGGVPPSGG